MMRSKRMEPVMQLAQNREQEAARQVGEHQRQLDAQRTRLAELTAYRDEYAQRLTTVAGGGLGAAMLHDYRAFLARLNQAIEHQRRLIEQGEHAYEESRRQWLQTRQKTKALDTVTERYRLQERRDEERRLQNESDERAQRMKHGGYF